MSSKSGEQPLLLIIAGPNGSGKSSVYENTGSEWSGRSIWIVNPDLLTARIRDTETMSQAEANLAAITRIEAWLDASIDVHKSIGVETVLSTGKYRRLVEKAKQRGFLIWLLYVFLDDPGRNVERVKLRVHKGGHAVPEDKIRARYLRSFAQLSWFLNESDAAWIYDNSGTGSRLVGEKRDGLIALDPDVIAPLKDAIQSITDA